MSDEHEKTRIVTGVEGFPPGTRLNDTYVIDNKLALGGMAEVYRGRNIHTDEPVAIKIVLPEYSREATILALFRKEATVLSRLSHDAIVRYLSFTVEPVLKRPYLVMEFVDGVSLLERLQASRLDAQQTSTVIWRVASGLAAAHAAGVVHRDLSPDNVILPENDPNRTKIIDFGIAKSATGEGTLLGGKFAGKYNFVSPEQLGLYGGEVTERSDIYSLGLIAAAANLGSSLDMSGSHADVLDKRRSVPGLDGVDATLQPLIARMLEPDPAQRIASMNEVLQELMALGAGGDAPIGSWPYPATAGNKSVPPLGRPMGSPDVAAPPDSNVAVSESPFGPAGTPSASWQPPGGHGAQPRKNSKMVLLLGLLVAAAAGTAGAYYLGWLNPIMGGAANQIAAEPPAPARLDTQATNADVLARLAQRDLEACTYIQPLGPAGNMVAVRAMGGDPTMLGALQASLQPPSGVPVVLTEEVVEPVQCPIVELLRDVAVSVPGAQLSISTDNLPSGGELRGVMNIPEGWTGYLYIVDYAGWVYDVSGYLQQQGEQRVFAMSLGAQSAQPTPQILLATYVRGDSPITDMTGSLEVAAFAGQVRAAMADTANPVAIASAYFRVNP